MADKRRRLDRVLRVRTLQLTLVRAEEARARDRISSEVALRDRIVQLAGAVAPAPAATEALSFIAAAHFRDRLNQSAVAADRRIEAATTQLDAASEASRAAKRDQTAIEKLIDRDRARAVVKAMRALEHLPPVRRNRHDPC